MQRITDLDLRRWSRSDFWRKLSSDHLKSSSFLANHSVFLSYSHRDGELARGLVNRLGALGVDIYVDWRDPDLPRTTSRRTAEAIKQRIGSSDLLLVLATQNAMRSRWVPWEIGVGDSKLDESRILIAPVTDSDGDFHGSEYLKLYRRIEIKDYEMQVIEPHLSFTSEPLRDYLQR